MKAPEFNLTELAFRAESGDSGAQFQLGMILLLGEGVGQDLTAANRWIARAAEANHPGAQILAQQLALIEQDQRSGQINLHPAWPKQILRRFVDSTRSIGHWLWGNVQSKLAHERPKIERVGSARKTTSLVDAA